MTALYNFLGNNKSEPEIEKFLDGLCDDLP